MRTHLNIPMAKPSDERDTPQELFDALNSEFGFTLDAAASAENAKCERYFTIADNAVRQSWAKESVWMNPPYSQLPPWIDKAIASAHEGATVVALLPVTSGSRWFDTCMLHADEVRFIEGRLAFNGMDQPAKFPSCVFVFYPRSGELPAMGRFVPRTNRKSGARWISIQLRPHRGGTR